VESVAVASLLADGYPRWSGPVRRLGHKSELDTPPAVNSGSAPYMGVETGTRTLPTVELRVTTPAARRRGAGRLSAHSFPVRSVNADPLGSGTSFGALPLAGATSATFLAIAGGRLGMNPPTTPGRARRRPRPAEPDTRTAGASRARDWGLASLGVRGTGRARPDGFGGPRPGSGRGSRPCARAQVVTRANPVSCDELSPPCVHCSSRFAGRRRIDVLRTAVRAGTGRRPHRADTRPG
jgi:hypothetical protein